MPHLHVTCIFDFQSQSTMSADTIPDINSAPSTSTQEIEIASNEKEFQELVSKHQQRSRKVTELAINSKKIWKGINHLSARFARATHRLQLHDNRDSSSEEENDKDAKLGIYRANKNKYENISKMAMKIHLEFKKASKHEQEKFNCLQNCTSYNEYSKLKSDGNRPGVKEDI